MLSTKRNVHFVHRFAQAVHRISPSVSIKMCSQNFQNKIIEVISQCVERVNCQESDKRDCNLKENELLFNIIKAMSYVPTQWAIDVFVIALKVIDNSLSQKSIAIFEKF